MMNIIWVAMLLSGMVAAAINGKLNVAGQAMLTGAQDAALLLVSLWGGYSMWMGFMRLLEKSDLSAKLARALKAPVAWLVGKVSDAAMEPMLLNISANLLGLGGAATPLGLKAMAALAQENPTKGVASDAMCMFFIINASSIQLVPTTVLTLRASAGSANAGIVILPTLLATAASALAGISSALLLRRWV